MDYFNSFSEASAHAKAKAASTNRPSFVRRSGDGWEVISEQARPTQKSQEQVPAQSPADEPYDFPVLARQWRELEEIRRTDWQIQKRMFHLHHAVESLDLKDKMTVKKYGEFLHALRQKRIRPENDVQEHFVDVFTNGGKTNLGVERAWLRFLREVEYCEALYFSGRDEAEYRSRLRKIAAKGHKQAKEIVQSLAPWNPNPPPDKKSDSGYKSIDYEKLRGARFVPGSYGSRS